VVQTWPRETAGTPLAVSLTPAGEDTLARVTYLGTPLPASTRELIERELRSELGMVIKVSDGALPSTLVAPSNGWRPANAGEIAVHVQDAKVAGLWICLTLPDSADKSASEQQPARELLLELVTGYDRKSVRAGERIVLEFATDECRTPEPSRSTGP